MNLSTKQKQTHRHREQTGDCQGGEGFRGGMEWEVGVSRCKLLYIEWVENKILFYSTGDYIQYPVIKHMERNTKRNIYIYIYIHVYI